MNYNSQICKEILAHLAIMQFLDQRAKNSEGKVLYMIFQILMYLFVSLTMFFNEGDKQLLEKFTHRPKCSSFVEEIKFLST